MPRGANPRRDREGCELESKFEKSGRYQGSAAYAGTVSFAQMLGNERIAELLEHPLLEEWKADATLTGIAESTVNREARQRDAYQQENRS